MILLLFTLASSMMNVGELMGGESAAAPPAPTFYLTNDAGTSILTDDSGTNRITTQ